MVLAQSNRTIFLSHFYIRFIHFTYVSVQVPVSGSHSNTLSGDTFQTYLRIQATFDEIDKVESVFEDFRTKINAIGIQYPKHSLFPQVAAMVETMVWSDDEGGRN